MAELSDVLDEIGSTINSYYNASSLTATPMVIFKGWPAFEDLTKVLQAQGAMINVWPVPNGMIRTTRFLPFWMGTYPTASLNATSNLAAGTITFADFPTAGLNVHTIINNRNVSAADCYYQCVLGDTLTSVATNVAAAINAKAIAGVSAVSSGPVVTITGASSFRCNVGASTTLSREVRRVRRYIDVMIWCTTGQLRDQIEALVLDNLGIVTRQFLPLPDGTSVWIKLATNTWDDDHSLDSTLYRSICRYTCEYATLETETATQVGATQMNVTTSTNIGS